MSSFQFILNDSEFILRIDYVKNVLSDSSRELSYEFLMQCAKGPFAKRPPADWDRIQKDCPSIVRKVQNMAVDDNANTVSTHAHESPTNTTHFRDSNNFRKSPIQYQNYNYNDYRYGQKTYHSNKNHMGSENSFDEIIESNFNQNTRTMIGLMIKS